MSSAPTFISLLVRIRARNGFPALAEHWGVREAEAIAVNIREECKRSRPKREPKECVADMCVNLRSSSF